MRNRSDNRLFADIVFVVIVRLSAFYFFELNISEVNLARTEKREMRIFFDGGIREFVGMYRPYRLTKFVYLCSVAEMNLIPVAPAGLNKIILKAYFVRFADFYLEIVEIEGSSLYQYILNYRIIKAGELIENSEYSFTQIAQITGWKDYAQFSKAFKKHFGCSPSAFHVSNKN